VLWLINTYTQEKLTMVTVSYPGVYIQEIPSGVRTITGVSTSIGAFFGRTTKGLINKAVRCLSFSDFIREFGSSHPSSNLGQSVKQFFDNGGNDCYVVRVAREPRSANIVLKNLGGSPVLNAIAKNAGNWGNAVYLEVDYNTPNPDETFNLRVIYREGGTEIASEPFTNLSMNPASPRFAPSFVTQSSKSIDLKLATGFNPVTATPTVVGYSESHRPFDTAGTALVDALNALINPASSTAALSKFEISVNDSQYISIDLRENPISLFSGDRAVIATQLTSRINTQLNAAVTGLQVNCQWLEVHTGFYLLRILSDTPPRSSVRIRRSPANDLAGPLMLGLDQGGIEVVRYSNFRPVPTATFLTGDINDIAELTQTAFNQLVVSGNTVSLQGSGGSNLLQTTGGTDRWYRDNLPPAANNRNDGVREKLRIIAQKINNTPSLPFRAEVWGYHLALIPTTGTINTTLSITTGNAGGGGTNIGTGAATNMFTSNVRQYALGATGTSTYQDGAGTIGRDDDGNPLTTNDFIGNEAEQTGFHALDSVDIFNLMVIPEDTDIGDSDRQTLYGKASIYCQQKRAFLLMDAPESWTNNVNNRPTATNLEVNSFRALVIKDYSAVFYPKIQYSDAGVKKSMGASGLIAGLMARIDSTRGVWKAPAGIEADLRGIVDLEVNLTDKENGVLNKLGVNCLRKFPSGFVNWGARTMDGSDDIGSEWKYIPIRRLALFLEESLYRGTKWVVFEPNDEPLWAQIRLNIGAFMNGLFRQGAFQGSTPDKAFFVKCDSETTTQADRNLGIVNIEVGFAPLKPAEFVIIKIQQIAGDLQ
jgi:uncharacterized protein